jgi:murein DD-endopeptidase MepM/ murein hydrolase activator NlpD
MGRSSRDDQHDDRFDDRDTPRRAFDDEPYDDEDEYTGDDTGERDGYARALALRDGSANLPALSQPADVAPVIIPGTGVSMGNPFIKRRERPLTLRLAVLTLMICILVTGLFAATPLGGNANAESSFEALAGAVVYQQQPSFHWYWAKWGDTTQSIAQQFNVQEGGIYEMNGLMSGQEITVGKAYKIPDDPLYGKDYIPPSMIVTTGGNGATVFGSSPWTSIAGDPGKEALCGPNGNGDPAGYQLQSPNKGAAWVRGFSWYHNGVDIANPAGAPITAAQSGEVIWAGWDVGGLGYSVKINHCNGVSTVYGHMEQLLVKAGENVEVGETVGLEGSTGWSTGPHLHFMVEWYNNPVDPLGYYNWSTYNITH